jgi:hypothetical protein
MKKVYESSRARDDAPTSRNTGMRCDSTVSGSTAAMVDSRTRAAVRDWGLTESAVTTREEEEEKEKTTQTAKR